jgi:hypothetical protein
MPDAENSSSSKVNNFQAQVKSSVMASLSPDAMFFRFLPARGVSLFICVTFQFTDSDILLEETELVGLLSLCTIELTV